MCEKADMMQKKKGYTLVEVLVVIAIIGIASAITLASVSGGRVKKQVEGDARRLAGALREVQNNALAGERMEMNRISCSFSFAPSVATATTILSTYQYRNGATCAATLSAALPVFQLTPGVSISAANAGVSFMVPWGQAWDGLMTAPLVNTVQYILVKSGVTWSVCIYPEGRIEEAAGAICP